MGRGGAGGGAGKRKRKRWGPMAALGLVLAGLCLAVGGGADVGRPPRPLPPLRCTLLGAEGGGVLPGALSARPALLRLRGGADPPPDPDPHPDDVIFDVTDPWDTLAEAWGTPESPPKCELSPTVPASTPPRWAPALVPDARSPPTLGGAWWVVTLGTPSYGVTALLQGRPRPGHAPATPVTPVNVTLAVFSPAPALGAPPGAPLELPCAFAAPPGPFALEWRHQHRGRGRRLLAYDAAAGRAPLATPGAELLLGGAPGGAVRAVTLRLAPLAVAHRGTFVCSVFLPHGHAQQLLHVSVLAPPTVTLSPSPLVVAPGAAAEVRCDAAAFFPLDVTVRWWRRAASSPPASSPRDALAGTWSSGHRRRPDGTYSRSTGARLGPARLRHHGDVVTCEVTHRALAAPRRLALRLRVAGAEGPGTEDAVALFLVAFVLGGLWRGLRPDQQHKSSA
ncbi:LOW QUALITY PROTEIN: tapasin [Phalacrocorax carbo]|uniref:LOW QUALITY PROTEIN: tapasin n=1 Tax=Phalacrocorax carbo TaxID=9209 RepID=UPI003119624F